LSIALLALAGCSDDGLAPPIDTDAGSSGNVTTTNDGSDEGPPASTGTVEGSGGTTSQAEDSSGSGTSGAGTGTTGELPPATTCEGPDQCVLVNDCCQCAAAHVDDEVPPCDMECDQPMCDALGLGGTGVVCLGGECRLEPHDCSGVVACDSLPPACPEGSLPEVGPGGGGCWTGACIPAEACDPVPGCDYCEAGDACVETVTQQGAVYSCRAVPEGCDGVPTCECMPPDTCQMPFDVCADADGMIQCTCPAC
jgi:hypothetical protein